MKRMILTLNFACIFCISILTHSVKTDTCKSKYKEFWNETQNNQSDVGLSKNQECVTNGEYSGGGKSLLLEDGACISRGYKKGVVPQSMGIIESSEVKTPERMDERGWDCKENENDIHCRLPYTYVYTSINDYTVRDINDQQGTITLDLSLTMVWMDQGIKTYKPKYNEGKEENEVSLPLERIEDIWTPHLHIYNLSDYSSYKNSKNMVSLKVMATNYLEGNGLCLYGPMVSYQMEAKITFYCDFDYSSYPMEYSICKFRFSGQRSNLKFTLAPPEHDELPEHRIKHLGYFDTTASLVEEKDGKHGQVGIGLDIQVHRVVTPFVLKYYLPGATITIVSQLSFIIPFSALPGRVALIVTQFLTLTSLFIHQMGESPTGSQVDKLQCYLLVSLFFVFGTMIEFAIALVLYRRCGDETNKISDLETSNGKAQQFIQLRKKWREQKNRNKITSNNVDIAACILFPLAYIIFNGIYWGSFDVHRLVDHFQGSLEHSH